MEIKVDLLDGQKVKAYIGDYEILSDQSKKDGGEGSGPNPLQFFLASTAMCVSFYVNSFCKKRQIPTDNIKVIQSDSQIEEGNFYKRKIDIKIDVPSDFPEKYKAAVLKTAQSCTVKHIIMSGPEFNLSIN